MPRFTQAPVFASCAFPLQVGGDTVLPMDVNDIRRWHLRELIKDLGSVKALAEIADTDPNYISSIIGKKHTRNLGDDVARRIEEKRGMPLGALDLPPGRALELALKLMKLPDADVDELIRYVDTKSAMLNASPSYADMTGRMVEDMRKRKKKP